MQRTEGHGTSIAHDRLESYTTGRPKRDNVIAFGHILCAIDFSDPSNRALVYATALALKYQARLTILHVVPMSIESMPSYFRGVDDDRWNLAAVRDAIVAQMRRASEKAGAGSLSPTLLIDEGRVHEAIVGRAAALPADLLVVGTHGRGGFNRLLLGSVAEKVLRTASCPVLAVPPVAPSASPAEVSFARILCPVDSSASSVKALAYALDLGRQANGCVTVLNAIEYMDQEEPCAHVPADLQQYRQRAIEHARERLHAHVAGAAGQGCRIEEIVTVNRAYRAILERAAAGTDLIVMGAQGFGGAELMLYGSNTQHVVRHAVCPVLTVRA